MNKKTPDESKYFEMSMRGVCPDLEKVHLFTDRKKIEVEEMISFDNEFEGFSSISYFLGSLLSSIILTAIKELKHQGIELDEIEGVVHATLTNPLRMIPVRGYDQPSNIENIMIKIYYYSDEDENKVSHLIEEVQKFNPVYRLINQSCPVKLDIEWVL